MIAAAAEEEGVALREVGFSLCHHSISLEDGKTLGMVMPSTSKPLRRQRSSPRGTIRLSWRLGLASVSVWTCVTFWRSFHAVQKWEGRADGTLHAYHSDAEEHLGRLEGPAKHSTLRNVLSASRSHAASGPHIGEAASMGSDREGILSTQAPTDQPRCQRGHQLIVASTSGGDQLCRFLEFGIRNGMEPRILGYQQPWQGWLSKVTWVIEELSTYPGDCMVLITDTDMIFQSNWTDLYTKFSGNMGGPNAVFGADCGCWPQVQTEPAVCKGFPKLRGPGYRYVNGGFVMGRADKVLEVYTKAVRERHNSDSFDDQEELNNMYFDKKTRRGMRLALDVNGSFVNPLHKLGGCQGVQAFEFRGDRWFNTWTQRYPSILHFNGFTKAVAHLYAHRLRQAVMRGLGQQRYDAEMRRVLTTRLDFGDGTTLPFYRVCPAYTEMFRPLS